MQIPNSYFLSNLVFYWLLHLRAKWPLIVCNWRTLVLTVCGDTHNLFHSLFIKSCGCHINFVGGFMSETLDLLGKPEWISLVNHSAALVELEEQDLFKTMTSHWPCMTVIYLWTSTPCLCVKEILSPVSKSSLACAEWQIFLFQWKSFLSCWICMCIQ